MWKPSYKMTHKHSVTIAVLGPYLLETRAGTVPLDVEGRAQDHGVAEGLTVGSSGSWGLAVTGLVVL